MSKDIFVNVHRNGSQISGLTNIYCQLDTMQQQEAAYYGGAAPFFRYNVYILANLDIRQSDALIDQNNIDPRTGTNAYYRVISDPEPFPDQHMEIIVERVRGS